MWQYGESLRLFKRSSHLQLYSLGQCTCPGERLTSQRQNKKGTVTFSDHQVNQVMQLLWNKHIPSHFLSFKQNTPHSFTSQMFAPWFWDQFELINSKHGYSSPSSSNSSPLYDFTAFSAYFFFFCTQAPYCRLQWNVYNRDGAMPLSRCCVQVQ